MGSSEHFRERWVLRTSASHGENRTFCNIIGNIRERFLLAFARTSLLSLSRAQMGRSKSL